MSAAVKIPSLADDDAIFGNARGERFGRGERDVEGFQVAIVDADETAGQPQGAVEFFGIMDFDNGIHAPVACGGGEGLLRGHHRLRP